MFYVTDFKNVKGLFTFFSSEYQQKLVCAATVNFDKFAAKQKFMYRVLIVVAVVAILLSSCSKKEIKQGKIIYTIEYELPDSLTRYAAFLPKQAIVYFKGDSTVSVQQAGDEATTVITQKPTDFMRVLLLSSNSKYVIDYAKAQQPELLPATSGYTYEATADTMTIAGYKAKKYQLTDKATGLTSEAWFTQQLSIVPNYLTTVFDTTYGTPLAFTTRQNDLPVKTTLKEVKFEPVPDGIFSTPKGYQKITPDQFKNMPLGN